MSNALFDRAQELWNLQEDRFEKSGQTKEEFLQNENEADIRRRILELQSMGERNMKQS